MKIIKPNIVTLELSVEEINILTMVLINQVGHFRERKLFGEPYVKMCQLEEQFREVSSQYRIKRASLFDVTEGE